LSKIYFSASGSPYARTGISPRQSPTPSASASDAGGAVDVGTFISDGGTTYFYNPADELVSAILPNQT
jgi:hypothetical protein